MFACVPPIWPVVHAPVGYAPVVSAVRTSAIRPDGRVPGRTAQFAAPTKFGFVVACVALVPAGCEPNGMFVGIVTVLERPAGPAITPLEGGGATMPRTSTSYRSRATAS